MERSDDRTDSHTKIKKIGLNSAAIYEPNLQHNWDLTRDLSVDNHFAANPPAILTARCFNARDYAP